MRLALIVVIALMFAPLAQARSDRDTAKRTWYHANGYIHAIGKNARRTIYHPNPVIRRRWQRDLRFLVRQRHRAWLILHPEPEQPSWLEQAFSCIHRYEGAWDANTGNGYYGGLQMDTTFQRQYGPDFMSRWGTADRWPVWAQVTAAARAYGSGRGFGPWPNTARACGLL